MVESSDCGKTPFFRVFPKPSKMSFVLPRATPRQGPKKCLPRHTPPGRNATTPPATTCRTTPFAHGSVACYRGARYSKQRAGPCCAQRQYHLAVSWPPASAAQHKGGAAKRYYVTGCVREVRRKPSGANLHRSVRRNPATTNDTYTKHRLTWPILLKHRYKGVWTRTQYASNNRSLAIPPKRRKHTRALGVKEGSEAKLPRRTTEGH